MEVETEKPPLSETWTRWEGQTLNGAFALGRCLGSSDHSGVFLTEQGGQAAALKLVPAIPTLAESQLSHWSAAAALEHPHLIHLARPGRCQLGGSPYLYVVMDYAEQNLAQLLRHRPLTEAELREMLPLTLEALGFLHARGMVQGQLKPSNVLVVGNQLKLASDTIRPADEASASIGMLSIHNPPEARDGSFSTAGDIWALGVTLCEALTRRTPTLAGERRDVVLLPPDVPAGFNDILRRCLARNPAQRPSVTDLQEWVRTGAAAFGATAPPEVSAGADAGVGVASRAGGASGVPGAAGSESRGASRLVIRAVINKDPPPEEVVERRSVVPWVVAVVVAAGVAWGAWSWFGGRSPGAAQGLTDAQSQAGAAAGQAAVQSQAEAQGQPGARGSAGASSAANPSSGTTGAGASAAAPADSNRAAPGGTAAQSAATAPDASTGGTRSRNTNRAHAAADLPADSVLQDDIPSVSPRARATIHGHVKVVVRVTVDNSGAVVDEDLVREGPSKYFARLATESARKWRFKPADSTAPRQSLLRFEFSHTGTTAHVVTTD